MRLQPLCGHQETAGAGWGAGVRCGGKASVITEKGRKEEKAAVAIRSRWEGQEDSPSERPFMWNLLSAPAAYPELTCWPPESSCPACLSVSAERAPQRCTPLCHLHPVNPLCSPWTVKGASQCVTNNSQDQWLSEKLRKSPLDSHPWLWHPLKPYRRHSQQCGSLLPVQGCRHLQPLSFLVFNKHCEVAPQPPSQ